VAQLTVTGRAANGVTGALIGVAYLLRAVGDGSSAGWVTWLSPVGWTGKVQAYAGERWWVLLLSVAAAGGTSALAVRIAGRRDLGSGLLPERPGPPTAPAWLAGAPALAVRLNRAAAASWTAAYLVAGLGLGALAGSVGRLVGGNAGSLETLRRIGGSSDPVDAYVSTLTVFAAVVAAAFSVQVVLRMRAEETSGRAESVLAGSASRLSWAGSQAGVALAGPVLLMLAFGLGLGLMVALAGEGDVGPVLGAALVAVPAVWVVAGVAVLLVGVLPQGAPGAWAAVVLSMLITLFGPLADLGGPVLDVSPFTHVPKLPDAPMIWAPMIWLSLVAAALVAAGLGRLRTRDLG
jgi:ABC-2 type transport system permease protein